MYLIRVSSSRNLGLGSVYEVSEASQHYIILVLSAFRCIIEYPFTSIIIPRAGKGSEPATELISTRSRNNRTDNTDAGRSVVV